MRLNSLYKQLISLCLTALLGLLITSTAQANSLDARIFSFQQKVANTGNMQSQYKLAYMYEMGRGTGKDVAKAVEWYKKAAAQKSKAASHRLIYLGVKASGLKPQQKNWVKTVIKDANSGDDDIMFLLASMYENGVGVESNLDLATRYYKKATAKGNADAEAYLFRLEQKINKARTNEQQKLAAEKAEEKAEAKKQAQSDMVADKKAEQARKQRELQLKAENDRKRLAAERKKLATEKRQLAQQMAELRKIQEEAKKIKKQEEKSLVKTESVKPAEEVFETDLCSGAAARFRTQCN